MLVLLLVLEIRPAGPSTLQPMLLLAQRNKYSTLSREENRQDFGSAIAILAVYQSQDIPVSDSIRRRCEDATLDQRAGTPSVISYKSLSRLMVRRSAALQRMAVLMLRGPAHY